VSRLPTSWEKDFYALLEVKKSDDMDTIKKSYRRLAREHHPDRNPGNKDAEERFKEVSEAYDVLSDDHKRKEYDEYRALRGTGQYRPRPRPGSTRPGPRSTKPGPAPEYDYVYEPPSFRGLWRWGRRGVAIAFGVVVAVFAIAALLGGAMSRPVPTADHHTAASAPTAAPGFPAAAAAKAASKGFTPVHADECLTDSRNQWIKLVNPDPAAGHWAPTQGKRGYNYGGQHPGSAIAWFSYDQHSNTVTADWGTTLAGLAATDVKGGKHYYALNKATSITAPLYDPLNPGLALVELQFCGNA